MACVKVGDASLNVCMSDQDVRGGAELDTAVLAHNVQRHWVDVSLGSEPAHRSTGQDVNCMHVSARVYVCPDAHVHTCVRAYFYALISAKQCSLAALVCSSHIFSPKEYFGQLALTY